MSGLHVVRKRMQRYDRYYVYAWRGGPCIHKQDDIYPVITPAILAKQLKAYEATRKKTDGRPFELIITAYRDSPEFTGLADSTKRDYKLWLNRISDQFGNVPLEAFEDRRMRGEIMTWRDTWRDNPRTADKASVMMATIIGWAVERGIIKSNVASKIRQLHKVNKADKIWEPEHWEAFHAAEPPEHLVDALTFASLTGLRLSDLVKVTWDQVFPTAIKINQTQKRKSRAVIPILPELRTWMKDRDRSGTILKNSRGFGWSASGLGCVFQRNKPEGFDRTIHDLRGTFATRLIMAGLTDEQAAMVLGWSAKRIADIRARYVDEERVILSLADKLTGTN